MHLTAIQTTMAFEIGFRKLREWKSLDAIAYYRWI